MGLVSEVIPIVTRLIPSTSTKGDQPIRGRVIYSGRLTLAVQIAADIGILTAAFSLLPGYTYIFESINAGIRSIATLGNNGYINDGLFQMANARLEGSKAGIGDNEFYPLTNHAGNSDTSFYYWSSWSLDGPPPLGLIRAPPDLATSCLFSADNQDSAECPGAYAFFRASFLLFDIDMAEQFPLGSPIPLISQ